MKNGKISVGAKIFGGFIALIFVFSINAAVSVITINDSKKTIQETAEIIDPSAEAIEDFLLLTKESKMLITNWVYLQNNQEDKDALKELQNFRYPALKDELTELSEYWDDEEEKRKIDSVFANFEALIGIEQEIMTTLISFEDYEDPMLKLLAENIIEDEVLLRTSELETQLSTLSEIKQAQANEAQASIISASNYLRNITLILGLVTITIGLIGAFLLSRSITRPISYVKNIVVKLSRGELPERDRDQSQSFSRDEIGEMAHAVDGLVNGLRATSTFAENIGRGQYDASFTPQSKQDVLGNALLEMRDNLSTVAEEDKIRRWATEGTATFGELLRQNSGSVRELCNAILIHLIEYLHANQGGFFIVQDDESSDELYMTLEACYAWDRQKYIEQKIYRGEGLAGQAWMEKDTLYITDVPDEYVTISSGLGEANPTSILIVPLIVNDEVYGVVEVASFDEYQPHEIEFMKKIAESIASTISTARNNTKTRRLLEETTQMSEQMQAQEEEMRQNMEEIQATQEEMTRKQIRSNEKELLLETILDSALECLVSIDENNQVDYFNQSILKKLGYTAEELTGMHASKLFQGMMATQLTDFLEQNTDCEVAYTVVSKQKEAFLATVQTKSYTLEDQVHYTLHMTKFKKHTAKAAAQA